jgi:hypothetical protein
MQLAADSSRQPGRNTAPPIVLPLKRDSNRGSLRYRRAPDGDGRSFNDDTTVDLQRQRHAAGAAVPLSRVRLALNEVRHAGDGEGDDAMLGGEYEALGY